MRRLPTLALLALALAPALGGCGPVNRGLSSVNQPVVSRTDYVLDVSGDALRSGSTAEAARIDAWFQALRLGYGDRVSIDDPTRSADEGVRDAVSGVLARHGLLLSEATPVTAGEIAPGSVRVVVSRSIATVPDCPNWSRSSQPEFAGSTMSNYGCATNTNLAAMVANPEDLVRGASAEGNDPRSVNKAIRAYRDTPSTAISGLKTESTKNGN
ncbi:CpaD family pilus assembly protein [Sphingomonas profundi]|uniref:CpaD family pilus assembly protein n=1 Tax=Alterirhizorhabdus profundi TaxID=2681549 RepID=UPI0018D1E3DF|nr:CpaD family pilus assembly protein [Sphingomonas profundi]